MNPDLENSELDSSLESEQSPYPAPQPAAEPPRSLIPKGRWRLLAVAAILVIILVVGLIIGLSQRKKPATNIVINTQSLDAGTLTRLESQNKGGSINQQLTITPNTLFKNNVNVQGNLTVNGTSHLQSAVTAGSSLAVSGPLTVGSSTTIGGNLSVSGLITAGGLSVGSLTIASLHTNGDLVFGGHLVNSGLAPAGQAGSNAGSGAKVTVTGNDTAGMVSVVTGSNPSAGQIAQVNFRSAFKLAPYVQLTPVNSDAAASQYYATTSAGFFIVSIGANVKPDTAYNFYYLASQ